MSINISQGVSVIIPSFNRVQVLPRALDSVLMQRLPAGFELEIILIDDGSSDNTAELLRQQYPQVYYHYQNNQGVSVARNSGLRRVKYDWIALLDSDDEWLPNKLSVQFSQLQKTGLLVCHSDEIWIRNGERVNQMKKHQKRGGWVFQHCLPMCLISPSSIVFHREVIDKVGDFDELLPVCEDYDLWLRITAEFEVAFVEQALINKYGGHEDQLSRQLWGMDRFRVQALQKVLQQPLTAENRLAAEQVLQQKLQILLKGARKHANRDLIKTCQTTLAQLSEQKYDAIRD